MNIEEKRQLIRKLSKDSDSAFEKVLQKWTYEEIRQILCLESEKRKKSRGLTKKEIINILLKTVSEKNIGNLEVQETNSSSTTRNSKKQRNNLDALHNATPTPKTKGNGKGNIYCKNLACQAKLRADETFCKRCSCCICHTYDENKDPSLWLTCNSDPPFESESCGFSFHISCAFNIEKSGLKEDTPSRDVEGCFQCVSCGKTNCLLECLKKQLLIAKDDRRVDVLCFRLLLAQKVLQGSRKYKDISEKVEEAVKLLESEFDGHLPTTMCRGIVSRLCFAEDVKGKCLEALKLLDSKVATGTPQEEAGVANCNNLLSLPSGSADQINEREDRSENVANMENPGNSSFGFEQCAKVIRQLERSGYVDKIFRQKFLAWYSYRATDLEKRVVRTFVDTLKDDTTDLAYQLVSTFSDRISRKRSACD